MSKVLANIVNTIPPDADYPNGGIMDDTGSGDGTPVNSDVYSDIVQFFQKLLISAGITANDDPDNAANGYQLLEALNYRFSNLKTKIIVIQDWNMYMTGGGTAVDIKNVAHGLNLAEIKEVTGFIRRDDLANIIPFGSVVNITSSGELDSSIRAIDSTNIVLQTAGIGGFFDDAAYEGAGIRGWLVVKYTDIDHI